MSILCYNDYIKNTDALSFEEACEIHKEMIEEIGSDKDAIELYEELLTKANEYLNIRAKWVLLSLEDKVASDSARTLKHDALIVKFNQLAKHLQMNGKSADWRKTLGNEKIYRKRIGDMGCYLAYVHALNER